MPLTLVLGPANSAKAGVVLGAYALAAKAGALLVVPTAADVAYYNRELARTAPDTVMLGRALTFPGLIDEIAQRALYAPPRLTALQRQRLLREGIRRLGLQALSESARGPGFARAAGHLITELQQARVAPRRFTTALRAWAEGVPERIDYAAELAAIYRGYVQARDAIGLEDAETYAWGTLDQLRQNPDRWPGTAVFFYGFDDFTPIELDAIETLSGQAQAQLTVSLTYEPGRPALAARASVVEELRQHAQTVTDLPPLDDYYAPGARVALHHLERCLFEVNPPSVEPEEVVQLLEAGGERAEGELVAAEVRSALRSGVRPDEIVVVCRSLSRSGALFESALRRYGVACASARKLPLTHTALGRAVIATIRCALLPEDQATVADLLACLRTPGVSQVPAVVDRLEADLRVAGIQRIAEITNPAHRAAADPALRAIARLRVAGDRLAMLAGLTRALFVVPHQQAARPLSAAELLDARAATAILVALGELTELDRLRRDSAGAEELIELLESVEVAAGEPPGPDDVLIAEPLSIRARRFRRVIVTGLCEGEFPSPQATSADPFLGDDRRHELALAAGLALPVTADPLARERYLFYACVSRATERVTFSYRSADEDGNEVTESVFLADVAELFAPGWRDGRRKRLLSDVVWPQHQAPTEREEELARAAQSGAGAPGAEPATVVLGAAALAHIRHAEVVPAGALETFADCPVKWLVEYQLRANDLEPQAEPLARGSFIHAVLERVVADLDGPLRPGRLREAERLLGEAMLATPSQIGSGRSPEVRAAILRGVEADLWRYLQHEAAGDSDWIPMRMELRFGTEADALPPVTLTDGDQRVRLSGRIDRLDVEPGSGNRAIVRDYKSGVKQETWPWKRWVSDDQLQVGLYMLAVRRLLGLAPVAGFYQPLTGEDLRPRGVLTADAEIESNFVPTDEIGSAQLDELLAEIEREAVRIAAELRSGELTPYPARCSPNGSCSHPGICWAAQL